MSTSHPNLKYYERIFPLFDRHNSPESCHILSFLLDFSLVSGIFSLIGNGITIVVICRFPKLRTAANIFIANLAAADLAITILTFPFSVVSHFYNG